MADQQEHEPKGLGEHARGSASEYAHQQGWGLNQDERSEPAPGAANTFGGKDYDYGARDFGDEPVNMELDNAADLDKARQPQRKESAS